MMGGEQTRIAGLSALLQGGDPRPAPSTFEGNPDHYQLKMGAGSGVSRWAAHDRLHWGVSLAYDRLPAGVYAPVLNPSVGPALLKQQVQTDHLLTLPDDASTEIVAEFRQFWQLKGKFAEHGFIHKRGFLLWGPPGSGKTSCLQLMSKLLLEDDGIVLMLGDPDVAVPAIQMLRYLESERPIIALMEDVDALVRRHGESSFLALLDGEHQVANIVFVATTNYPEMLDQRFVNRPSRFDTIKFIGMPSAESRAMYLKAKAPSLSDHTIKYWVSLSDGYSLAHLKEMIVSVLCFGHKIDHVVTRMEEMRAKRPNSADIERAESFGFTGTRESDRLAAKLSSVMTKEMAERIYSDLNEAPDDPWQPRPE